MSREEHKDAIEVSIIFHEGQKMFAVPKQPAQRPNLPSGQYELTCTCGAVWDWGHFDWHLVSEPAQQQEPVAWIEHERSGSGLKHLHFDRREPSVRDVVINPVWTPLYTSPQPAQQEPVAWIRPSGRYMLEAGGYCTVYASDDMSNHSTPLYTSPPAQRPWVGLTDDEIRTLWGEWKDAVCLDHKTWAKAIEAKLKEKNQ